MTSSGARAQKPSTWCWFKSRPRGGNPLRNHRSSRRPRGVQRRGHHSTKPLASRNKRPRVLAPVTALPTARHEPWPPSQRCQAVTDRKKALAPGEPSPSTWPVERSRKSVRSRPRTATTGAPASAESVRVAGSEPSAACKRSASSWTPSNRAWGSGLRRQARVSSQSWSWLS